MSYRIVLLLASMILINGLPFLACADTVTLINGDRFTGKLMEREGKRLVLDTEYIGKIKIRWEYVRSLDIDKPALLLFDNGDTKNILSVVVREQEIIYRDVEDNELHTMKAQEIIGISPEAWMKNKDGIWDGKVNLSFKAERGNGEENFFDLDADITYRRKTDRFRVIGELENDSKLKFVTDERKDTKDKWLLRGSYNYFLNKKYYLGAEMTFEHDALADLHLRTTVGPIIGYQFFESKPLNFLAEVGLLRVKEDYNSTEDQQFVQPAWRINFDKYIIKNRLQFYHEQYGVMTLSSEEQWFFKSWTGFRVPLKSGILASAEYKFEYDNNPVPEADSTETTFRLKLGYRW